MKLKRTPGAGRQSLQLRNPYRNSVWRGANRVPEGFGHVTKISEITRHAALGAAGAPEPSTPGAPLLFPPLGAIYRRRRSRAVVIKTSTAIEETRSSCLVARRE